MIVKEKQQDTGHWYTRQGTPAYTTIGKTGERPTTLRDARKEGLLLFRLFFNDFCCFWGCCGHRAPLYKQIDTGSTGRLS